MYKLPVLTERGANKIQKWALARHQLQIQKKNWDLVFLKQAYEWAKCTHDAQTGCGAVIVRDKHIVSTGYNGFIRDIDDSILPNLRPEKYPWMIHAEHNAILDCARRGISADGCTIYVTGKPCLHCYQFMYQAGIKRIVYGNNDIKMVNTDEEYETNVEIFLWLTRNGLEVRHVDYPKNS